MIVITEWQFPGSGREKGLGGGVPRLNSDKSFVVSEETDIRK